MRKQREIFSKEEKDAIRQAAIKEESGDFDFAEFLRLLEAAKAEKGIVDS